jgi:hypothetical protein
VPVEQAACHTAEAEDATATDRREAGCADGRARQTVETGPKDGRAA